AWIADGEQVADRNVVPDPIVAAARLQQQHAMSGVGGQTVRQHATRRAGADDDVVVVAVERRCFGHVTPRKVTPRKFRSVPICGTVASLAMAGLAGGDPVCQLALANGRAGPGEPSSTGSRR